MNPECLIPAPKLLPTAYTNSSITIPQIRRDKKTSVTRRTDYKVIVEILCVTDYSKDGKIERLEECWHLGQRYLPPPTDSGFQDSGELDGAPCSLRKLFLELLQIQPLSLSHPWASSIPSPAHLSPSTPHGLRIPSPDGSWHLRVGHAQRISRGPACTWLRAQRALGLCWGEGAWSLVG